MVVEKDEFHFKLATLKKGVLRYNLHTVKCITQLDTLGQRGYAEFAMTKTSRWRYSEDGEKCILKERVYC